MPGRASMTISSRYLGAGSATGFAQQYNDVVIRQLRKVFVMSTNRTAVVLVQCHDFIDVARELRPGTRKRS